MSVFRLWFLILVVHIFLKNSHREALETPTETLDKLCDEGSRDNKFVRQSGGITEHNDQGNDSKKQSQNMDAQVD